jgi:hypothetical protein
MLKNFYAIIFTLLLMPTLWAQETESAVGSRLVDVSLPGGAQRILPGSVPAQVKETLEKMVAAVGEKAQQGETEVLVWAGANYKKANAPTIVSRLTDTLKVGGWQYEVAGEDSGVTIFSLLKDKGGRRAVMGFYGVTDDALVFAWTEVLPAGNRAEPTTQNDRTNRIEDAPVAKSAAPSGIIGTWTNGNVSTLQEKNLTTGAIASRGGSTFKYVFTADGRFEFVGLMQSTVYGCTTSLFNDKRGKYEINGSNITFIPSKNFWRNTYSCSPASNKERDYVLDRETYQFRTKTDEYGKTLVCLANAKGESCYRREE